MADKKSINYVFWIFLLALLAVVLISAIYRVRGPDRVAHPVWETDFQAAKEQAKAQNKDLLVNFAGSDWCYWCKRLDAEVMTDADFVLPAQQDFVFVLIDFPVDKSGQSQSLQDQNQRLAEQFAVQGFPTIILADADGNPYARTGYQQGGGTAYLAHIKELQAKKNQNVISK